MTVIVDFFDSTSRFLLDPSNSQFSSATQGLAWVATIIAGIATFGIAQGASALWRKLRKIDEPNETHEMISQFFKNIFYKKDQPPKEKIEALPGQNVDNTTLIPEVEVPKGNFNFRIGPSQAEIGGLPKQQVNNVTPQEKEPFIKSFIEKPVPAALASIVSPTATKPEAKPQKKQFNAGEFKENIKILEQNKTFLSSSCDLKDVVLQDTHKEILKKTYSRDIEKAQTKGVLKIISWTEQWGIIEFPDIPGVVFKLKLYNGGYTFDVQKGPRKGWVDDVGHKIFGFQSAVDFCKANNLYYLYIPNARLLEIDETSEVIIEERLDCPFPTWQEQEKIYEFIQKDSDLFDYSEELLKQLICFTIATGFVNTKYDKIPILPNGKVALHDLRFGHSPTNERSNLAIQPKTTGLYASYCVEEKGIFSHISDHRKKALKEYALKVAEQYCSNDELTDLKKKLS